MEYPLKGVLHGYLIRKSPNDQRSRAVCWGFFHALAAGARTVMSRFSPRLEPGGPRGVFLKRTGETPVISRKNHPGQRQQQPGKSVLFAGCWPLS